MPKKGSSWSRPERPRGAGATETESRPLSHREQRRIEAQRQREALRKRERRRRLLIRVVAVVGTIALVAGAVVFFIVQSNADKEKKAREEKQQTQREQTLLAEAPAAAEAAGCTDVETTDAYANDPENQDRSHVAQMPPIASYPTQPPASGPHNGVTLSAGVYPNPPPLEQSIHSLEHGAIVIWYSPDAPDAEIERIQDFFRQSEYVEKVIVAPYDYPEEGGTLPADEQMAMVAWHRIETCAAPSLPVAFSFWRSYRIDLEHPGRYKGEAPEPTSGI